MMKRQKLFREKFQPDCGATVKIFISASEFHVRKASKSSRGVPELNCLPEILMNRYFTINISGWEDVSVMTVPVQVITGKVQTAFPEMYGLRKLRSRCRSSVSGMAGYFSTSASLRPTVTFQPSGKIAGTNYTILPITANCC